LTILDAFAKDEIKDVKESVSDAYAVYKKYKDELETANFDEKERNKEMGFLEYEINEIQSANLKENEDVEDENDPLEEAQERKKQVDDERRENIINAIYDKAKVENKDQGSYFHIKVPEAFEKVNQRGKVFIKFIKNFKETEEYKNMPHKEHVEEPAPNKYFQTPSVKDEKRMKYLKSNPDKRTEDDEEKFKRYVDRRRMDTKMFKPMKTSIY
jgi:hypothetical protein